MRITYVTQTRFPTPRAHGKQVAEVCAAMAALGHEVTLLCPSIRTPVEADAFTYYDLPRSFEIRRVPHRDATLDRWVPGFLAFAVNMRRYKKAMRSDPAVHNTDLLYTRAPTVAAALVTTGKPVILELHTLPRFTHGGFARLCNRCMTVVCLTSPMRDALVRMGVQPDRIVVEADGVDLGRFAKPVPADEAKQRWKLPADRPVIGYVGTFVARRDLEKGVGILIDALALLKKEGVPFHGFIVGGPEEWRRRYDAKAQGLGLTPDLRLQGPVPSKEVPSALAACDVLVYPAPASDHPYFQRDTSPLKIFEYMAAGKPIVCADLPPLRDILDDSSAFFCAPGDAAALAAGIREALKNPQRAERSSAEVQRHDWKKRMQRVLASAQ